MARQKIIQPAIPGVPADRNPDHLAGQHVEDFLSPDNQGHFRPVTPMQAAVRSAAEPEYEDLYDSWAYRTDGVNGVARREWHEMNEPGGKTFRKGRVVF